MNLRKNRARMGAGIALVASLAVGGFGVAAAQADPSGCTVGKPGVVKVADNGLLSAKATATCNSSTSRVLAVEIKWDKNVLPDPLVAKNSDSGSKKSYSASVTACDGGNTRSYYARGYFTATSGDQHDSAGKHLTAC